MKKCKGCLKEKTVDCFNKRNQSRCFECRILYGRAYRKQFKDKLNTSRRQHRLKTLEIMGNKCIKCGFSDVRALQIDHIDGGGADEIRTWRFKGNYNTHVATSFLAKENKYQLLCANCNWVKKTENNEQPHTN